MLVVGVGIGGWLACEIAVKTTERIVAPGARQPARHQGRRPRDPRHRRHLVAHAQTRSMRSPISIRTSASATTRPCPKPRSLAAARNREATARVAWSPYMHNPKLKDAAAPHRRADADPVGHRRPHPVASRYGRAFAAAIPGARFETIERAGHYPHIEQPEEFARRALAFAEQKQPAKARGLGEQAMRVYQFTEQAYYPAWNDHNGSLRINLPNTQARSQARRRSAQPLLRRVAGRRRARPRHHAQRASPDRDLHVVDGGRRAVDPGAHHQEGAAAGARLSARPPARSAALRGGALDHRRASRGGRLDMGFVKGVPYEFPASNQNPVGVMDRLWEAHDFILKAMSHRGEPFNWEGEHFHYRQVNIWPRPVQQPHPPLWSTTNSKNNAHAARREGLRDRDARLRLRHAPALRRLPAGLLTRRTARRRAPTASPISGWSRSPTTRRRRAGAATWSPAICAPRRSCTSRTAIRPATSRSRTTPASCKGFSQPRGTRQGRPAGRHLPLQRAGPDRRRRDVLRHARPGLRRRSSTSANTAAAWATC